MPPTIRCRTDFEKSVIVANFEKRGWLQVRYVYAPAVRYTIGNTA